MKNRPKNFRNRVFNFEIKLEAMSIYANKIIKVSSVKTAVVSKTYMVRYFYVCINLRSVGVRIAGFTECRAVARALIGAGGGGGGGE